MEDGNGTIAYRVEQLERDLRETEGIARAADARAMLHQELIKQLSEYVKELADEVKRLRASVLTAALMVMSAAVAFAFAALRLVG